MKQPLALAIVQTSLRGLVLGAIPALLAGLTLRFLVPAPGSANGILKMVGDIGNRYPVPFSLALFLLFAALLRHWSGVLPAWGYLTALPAPITHRIARADLPTYAGAAETLRALGRPSVDRDLAKTLPPEQHLAFHEQLVELATAIAGTDVMRVADADRTIRATAVKALNAHARRQTVWFGVALSIAAGAALLLRLRVVETYQVLSGSMLPALAAGDRIVANKLAYRRVLANAPRDTLSVLPRRGDLVVFRNAVTDGPDHLVKRVIALPGDTVTMSGDRPVINGWKVPFCDAGLYVFPIGDGAVRGRLCVEFLGDHAYGTIQGIGTPFDRYVVSPNELFVLGDNRTTSNDSRTWNGGKGGGVPFADVEGRADWFLLATRRDGHIDLHDFLGPIDGRLSAEGIDASVLEQAIHGCIEQWPVNTRPPEPEASANGGDHGS